ncbi:hypothetical protein [Rummeliibacillus suwonensis]|uniref:hypothetical protein n=1 Tax=Rummeliibacillus suwonensis TaxID=1306154 RepID=UPI0016443AF5|nr:hypothetical protein [Rummeliibacillus suwonensis]MBO2537135.1 hypothetical protein [Rummeliibacillus suwonensis]
MTKRERIEIIGSGVLFGVIFGTIFNDMYHCLITGIVVASVIMVTLSQKAKKSNHFLNE